MENTNNALVYAGRRELKNSQKVAHLYIPIDLDNNSLKEGLLFRKKLNKYESIGAIILAEELTEKGAVGPYTYHSRYKGEELGGWVAKDNATSLVERAQKEMKADPDDDYTAAVEYLAGIYQGLSNAYKEAFLFQLCNNIRKSKKTRYDF